MYYKNIADYEALVAHKKHRKKIMETVVPEPIQPREERHRIHSKDNTDPAESYLCKKTTGQSMTEDNETVIDRKQSAFHRKYDNNII